MEVGSDLQKSSCIGVKCSLHSLIILAISAESVVMSSLVFLILVICAAFLPFLSLTRKDHFCQSQKKKPLVSLILLHFTVFYFIDFDGEFYQFLFGACCGCNLLFFFYFLRTNAEVTILGISSFRFWNLVL